MDLKEYNLPVNSMIGGWYIPSKICDELVHIFETNSDKHVKGVVGPHPARVNEDNHTPGVVGPPVRIDPSEKKSTELAIHPHYDHPSFQEYRNYLEEVIHKYEEKFPEVKNFDKFGMIESPQIQHYKPG